MRASVMRWRSSAAAALAAGPGGMRSLRRCGRPVAAAAIAAASRAMTCPLSRTITPSPSAASRCRAITIPLAVAMSKNSPPTGWLTVTWARGQLGWHRVAVAAVGHQRLARRRALLGDDHRIRCRRHRRQRFGLGDDGDRGAAVGGGPHAGVAAHAGEAVHTGLGLLDGDFVGQGAPPALRGGVVDLLHHALAVAAPRRADRHRDPVVLGHPGERGGDPARAGVADRGHPVEPPHPGHPTQATGDPVERGDQMRLILDGDSAARHLPECASDPTSRCAVLPHPQDRVDRAIPASPIGFRPRRVRDDRVRAFGRRAAGLADRAQARVADVAGQALIRQPEPQLLKLVEQGAGPQVRVLDQPRGDVVDERLERIRGRPARTPGVRHPGQIIADRLAVRPVWRAIAEIDQPRLRRACTSTSSSHVSMRKRASFDGAAGVRHQQHRGRPALSAEPHGWGISMSVSGEFQ